jgi:large subunit ribosomal protein L17
MFRNMVTSLLKHDRIQTTEAKAKELRRWADHIVTLAKRGDLHARRQAMSIVREKDVVHKIFEEASERFGAIHGGYTRIVRIGRRSGDAAPLTIVELVSADGGKLPKAKKSDAGKTVKPIVAETPQTAPQADPSATPAEASSEDVDSESASADADSPTDATENAPETDPKADAPTEATDK